MEKKDFNNIIERLKLFGILNFNLVKHDDNMIYGSDNKGSIIKIIYNDTYDISYLSIYNNSLYEKVQESRNANCDNDLNKLANAAGKIIDFMNMCSYNIYEIVFIALGEGKYNLQKYDDCGREVYRELVYLSIFEQMLYKNNRLLLEDLFVRKLGIWSDYIYIEYRGDCIMLLQDSSNSYYFYNYNGELIEYFINVDRCPKKPITLTFTIKKPAEDYYKNFFKDYSLMLFFYFQLYIINMM